MNEKIDFYCRRCRKSSGISYKITGDDDALVLTNIEIKCPSKHCRRVMYLKNYNEKKLLVNVVDNRFYI